MRRWRLILTGANDAFFNMALDEALLLSCRQGLSPPVLRLYQWDPPAVSIGYFQPAGKAVDLERCKTRGIQVVRRITGGRAVLHEDEVTYSVCASSDYFSHLGTNTGHTYQRISMALLESLRALGIEGEWVKRSADKRSASFAMPSSRPCFITASRHEITVKGKKLIGSAQRRFSSRSDESKKDGFIQHGSILTGAGKHSLAELLPGKGSIKTVKQRLEEESTNIERALNRKTEPDEIASALKNGFEKVFACRMKDSRVSERELRTAQSLAQERYLTEEWNLLR